jgi:hypothetical protein
MAAYDSLPSFETPRCARLLRMKAVRFENSSSAQRPLQPEPALL